MSREMRAQALVLESMLMHRPLPGINRAVIFPDFDLVQDVTQVMLVDERDPSSLGFPSQVRVTGRAEAEKIRAVEEQVLVLDFLQPEQFPGKLGVRLRASLAFPDRDPAPLGEIVATFDDCDPLVAVDPTHVLAY
jgi:hypothetical protein